MARESLRWAGDFLVPDPLLIAGASISKALYFAVTLIMP